jgi:hypothetical protein
MARSGYLLDGLLAAGGLELGGSLANLWQATTVGESREP